MEIGKEDDAIEAEPLKDPFAKPPGGAPIQTPAPERQMPVPEREKVPA